MVHKCVYILAVLLACCSGNRFSKNFNKQPLKQNNLDFYSEDNNFNVVPSINEYSDEPVPSCNELKQWWRFISALIRTSSHHNQIEDFSNLKKIFSNDRTVEKMGENEVIPETYSFGTFKDDSLKSVHRKTPEMADFASLGFGGFGNIADDTSQEYGEYTNELNDNSESETGFGGFGSFGGFGGNPGSNSMQNGHFSNDESGCIDIETKTCSNDKECSCLGFYRCNNMGKCRSTSSPGRASSELGEFHDRLVRRRRRLTVNNN